MILAYLFDFFQKIYSERIISLKKVILLAHKLIIAYIYFGCYM